MPKNQENQPHIPRTPIRFLIYISRPAKKWAFLAIAAVIVASAASQSTALIFKWIVDAIEIGDTRAAVTYGILFPAAVLLIQLMYRVSGFMGMHWIIDAKRYGGDVLFSYTVKHSHTYFSNRFAGSLLNKVTNVISGGDSLIHDFLWSYLSAGTSLLVTLYFIFTVDVVSAVLFVVLVVTILGINRLRMEKKRYYSKLSAAAGSKLRGSIVDVFTNITATRQYGAAKNEELYVEELGKKWAQLGRRSWRHSEWTQVLNSVVLFVFATGIFLVLTQRWEAGAISTGEVVFVLTLLSQLTGTLIYIGRSMTMYARVIGEMQEGLDEIVVPYEILDIPSAKPLSITQGEVVFDAVNFEFGNNKVFDDFNLVIAPGQRVGLVGHSGAGKTTFVSLLLRQHDVTGGAILIDGQNIAEVTQDSLRSAIAVVPQEPMLFHRTIRENIAYGKPDATDEEIIAVAKKAQAHEFISQLEKGYDTLVGERGIKLSGGQKQRVAIARAMLKNAPILVLDEATSALDSESEVAIQAALHKLMEGKTVVAVAHRLSTLREMDRIIVMENGKIIEDGTHDELSKAGSVYQRLWEHQAGGFLTV
jgi:ABC-type multidrug transport system fused ATPase/permease subunit